jgi:anti-sigma28 factor (negative regulator of flagellin synthesis)
MDIGLITNSHTTPMTLRPAADTSSRGGMDVISRRDADRVEWSGGKSRVRIGLVEEVKAQIAAGTYLTSARLDAALERLMSDLDITA